MKCAALQQRATQSEGFGGQTQIHYLQAKSFCNICDTTLIAIRIEMMNRTFQSSLGPPSNQLLPKQMTLQPCCHCPERASNFAERGSRDFKSSHIQRCEARTSAIASTSGCIAAAASVEVQEKPSSAGATSVPFFSYCPHALLAFSKPFLHMSDFHIEYLRAVTTLLIPSRDRFTRRDRQDDSGHDGPRHAGHPEQGRHSPGNLHQLRAGGRGHPLLRLRDDAVHKANLEREPRCSLFVQPQDCPARMLARVTLIGKVAFVSSLFVPQTSPLCPSSAYPRHLCGGARQ